MLPEWWDVRATARELVKLGYTNRFNLVGGFRAWATEGGALLDRN